MFNHVMCKSRKVLGVVKDRVTAAAVQWKAQHDAAFNILHTDVELVKRSPSVQIAAGTIVGGLFITGHIAPAVALAGAWLGSRPLTHLVATGVACVGEVDAAMNSGITRRQTAAPNSAADDTGPLGKIAA